jgi:hypothetical protein
MDQLIFEPAEGRPSMDGPQLLEMLFPRLDQRFLQFLIGPVALRRGFKGFLELLFAGVQLFQSLLLGEGQMSTSYSLRALEDSDGDRPLNGIRTGAIEG